jgi:hypothetical protein
VPKNAKTRKTKSKKTPPGDLTLRSRGLRQQLALARRYRPNVVNVNDNDGYEEDDLVCLQTMPWITDLDIVISRDLDLSPILSLDELRSLSVNRRLNIDLSILKNLEECYGIWSERSNLEKCSSLLAVGLDDFAKNLGYFSKCSRLQHIGLTKPLISSFVGLDNKELLSISVSNVRESLSFAGISGAPHLVEITISECKAISNLEEVAQLTELYELRLNKIKSPLKTLSPLRGLPHLMGLRFVGTKIVDGNLDFLRNLKWVGFDDKRHYSVTEHDLDQVLRAKGGGAVVMPSDYERHRSDIVEWRDSVARKHAISLSDRVGPQH